MNKQISEADLKVLKGNETPLFVIDHRAIIDKYIYLKNSIKNCEVLYSFKTNPHSIIVNTLNKIDSKFVVSSMPELIQLISYGVKCNKIYYHSIISTENEFNEIFKQGVKNVTINKLSDFVLINKIAKNYNIQVELGIRLNVNEVLKEKNAKSKFGLPLKDLRSINEQIKFSNNININAIGVHYGTNIKTPNLYSTLLNNCIDIADEINVRTINLGGGFPSQTTLAENNNCIDEYIQIINNHLKEGFSLVIEPGRYIVEDSCYCISEILSVEKDIAICDISTNILPTLINANYKISCPKGNQNVRLYGRLCYDGDVIFNNLENVHLENNSMIKISNTGAYTLGMRSVMGYPDINVIEI